MLSSTLKAERGLSPSAPAPHRRDIGRFPAECKMAQCGNAGPATGLRLRLPNDHIAQIAVCDECLAEIWACARKMNGGFQIDLNRR